MLTTLFVTTGAIPKSSSSTTFFFSSALSKGWNKAMKGSRFFSLTKARKMAAMCGRSKRRHCSTKLCRSRNVEIGHFCSRTSALMSFRSCSSERVFVACKNGSLMTHSQATFKLLKWRSFDLVERISTRDDRCEI